MPGFGDTPVAKAKMAGQDRAAGKTTSRSSPRKHARQQRAIGEKAATHQLLLEAAADILREGSIFDLTAIDLGRRAGVTRQTVYRYFPNTESIFKALSDQVISQIYDDLQLPSGANNPLDHFVTRAISVLTRDSRVTRQLALASALGRAAGSWHQVDPEALLVKVISERPERERPVSNDAAVAARLMITYFRGALYGWAAGFYSDTEFEKQVRLAGKLKGPDAF